MVDHRLETFFDDQAQLLLNSRNFTYDLLAEMLINASEP